MSEHGDRVLESNVLGPAEITALIDAADPRYRVPLLMAVLTGVRQGELLALRCSDIDWAQRSAFIRRSYTGGRLNEPKTPTSRRAVPLPASLISELRKWKLACPNGAEDLVFPNDACGFEDAGNLRARGFYPALRRAGMRRVRFHDLRHTAATLLLNSGEPPKNVQTLLGHASATIRLNTYAHAIPSSLQGSTDRLSDIVFGPTRSETVEGVEEPEADYAQLLEKMVAGVGIEPTTRGFSIRCSTN